MAGSISNSILFTLLIQEGDCKERVSLAKMTDCLILKQVLSLIKEGVSFSEVLWVR